MISVLKGHTREVKSVMFSPDGKTVASASLDTTVRTWNVQTGVYPRVGGRACLLSDPPPSAAAQSRHPGLSRGRCGGGGGLDCHVVLVMFYTETPMSDLLPYE